MADPQRAIDGRPADGRLTAPEQAARCPPQCCLRPGIEEMAGLAEQFVGDTGKTIGRIQSGDDCGTAFPLPFDDPVGLFHQRMRLSGVTFGAEISLF